MFILKTDGDASCAGQPFELDLRGNFPVADAYVQMILMQMEPEMRIPAVYNATTRKLILDDEVPTACDLLARTQAQTMAANFEPAGYAPNFVQFIYPVSNWEQAWHWGGGNFFLLFLCIFFVS